MWLVNDSERNKSQAWTTQDTVDFDTRVEFGTIKSDGRFSLSVETSLETFGSDMQLK